MNECDQNCPFQVKPIAIVLTIPLQDLEIPQKPKFAITKQEKSTDFFERCVGFSFL